MNQESGTIHIYEGHCHCGAIGFTYRTGLETRNWSVRACQCSFCRAHHALSTSDPAGNLEFSLREPELLSRYRFGQGITDFLICRRCGVYIGALIETAAGIFGIINVNSLTSIPADLSEPDAMQYDAESKSERLSRREQRWSPATLIR